MEPNIKRPSNKLPVLLPGHKTSEARFPPQSCLYGVFCEANNYQDLKVGLETNYKHRLGKSTIYILHFSNICLPGREFIHEKTKSFTD